MTQNNDVMREMARARAAEMQVIARTNRQLEEAGAIPRRRPLKGVIGALATLVSSLVSLAGRIKATERPTKAREARRA